MAKKNTPKKTKAAKATPAPPKAKPAPRNLIIDEATQRVVGRAE